jgi:hypothetical protein
LITWFGFIQSSAAFPVKLQEFNMRFAVVCILGLVIVTCCAANLLASGDLFVRATAQGLATNSFGDFVNGFPAVSEQDSDFLNASVSPPTFEITTDNNTGNATSGATAAHNDEKKLLAADLSGAAISSRAVNPIGGFLSAGRIEITASAFAEFNDELTFEFTPDDTPMTIQGVYIFSGFAEVEAVANGVSQARAEVNVALTGTNGLSGIWTARKVAGGGAEELNLDVNPVIDFTYDVISGVPFPIFLKLAISGKANVTDGCLGCSAVGPGVGIAGFEAHFGNSLDWGGITRVTNSITGEEITDWTVTSLSGFDYSKSFIVPEPSTGLLMLVGMGLLARARRVFGRPTYRGCRLLH